MVSQHSDGGMNHGPRPGARFPARILALAVLAPLLAGLTGIVWPDAGAYASVQQGADSGRWDDSGWDDWVFPFNPPADPADDGNQALAVSTSDGAVEYSTEFALVWAEDGDPVTTKNEAYAFASCTGCTAVAVGFQVVLIEEQTEVIAPGNHSAAVNYNCSECNTYALANQLVLSLGGPLSDDSEEQLWALWCEIEEYGRNLEDVPLSEIENRLEAYKAQITAIVQAGAGTTEDGITTSSEPAAEHWH
jgi:putative peptide zinc metalloprotease protein